MKDTKNKKEVVWRKDNRRRMERGGHFNAERRPKATTDQHE
jgi:hypothetical protein